MTYGASPIRRARATNAEVQARREALYAIVVEQRPMTIRQVFYAATVRGIVEKTEPDDEVASFYQSLQERYGESYEIKDAYKRVILTVRPTTYVTK